VRLVEFDDDLVRGAVSIYSEVPTRQGKSFWHYGKPFENVKSELSTYLDRSVFIGAYLGDELIGFIKLIVMENYADPVQIISKVRHRDKAAMNALLAKAVQWCAERRIPYLFYGEWSIGGGSLDDFKRNNGFERLRLPRYYVPLTGVGAMALKLRLHHGLAAALPPRLVRLAKRIRRGWAECGDRLLRRRSRTMPTER
jgi:hypothetical protein